MLLSDEDWLLQMAPDDVNNPKIPSVLLPAAAAETLEKAMAAAASRGARRLRGALRPLPPEQATASAVATSAAATSAATSKLIQPPEGLCPADGAADAPDAERVSEGEPAAGGCTAMEAAEGSAESSDGAGVGGNVDGSSCSWECAARDAGSVGDRGGQGKDEGNSDGRPCEAQAEGANGRGEVAGVSEAGNAAGQREGKYAETGEQREEEQGAPPAEEPSSLLLPFQEELRKQVWRQQRTPLKILHCHCTSFVIVGISNRRCGLRKSTVMFHFCITHFENELLGERG